MSKSRKLGSVFNGILLGVFLVGIVLSALVFSLLLRRNAEAEVASKALLLLESMDSVRTYTSNQIKPVLDTELQTDFLPQSVGAFAATEVFAQLRSTRKEYENFSYKQAALNPMNPRDQADDFESAMIERFRKDPSVRELSGFHPSAGGEAFYMARPITIDNASCLACHSTPNLAPRSLVARYGSERGFGWKMGDVIGVHIVSVPAEVPFNNAVQAFFTFIGVVFVILATGAIAINLLLRRTVIEPLARISTFAHEVSMGKVQTDLAEMQTPVLEVGELAAAFDRMRRSVLKGVKMLQSTYHFRGIELYKSGDLNGAIRELRNALSVIPDNVETAACLGRALADKGDYTGAETQYRAALKVQPDNANLHFRLGIALCRQDRRSAGIEELRTAVQLFDLQGDPAQARTVEEFLAGNLTENLRNPAPEPALVAEGQPIAGPADAGDNRAAEDTGVSTLTRLSAEELLARYAAGERDFSSFNLQKVSLVGADLRGTIFHQSDLRGADLSSADLRGSSLSGAALCRTRFDGADLSCADCVEANFSRASFSGARMAGSNLSWANFLEANLRDADLSWASLVCAQLNAANLNGADLSCADLRGAHLLCASLLQATLSETNLSWADCLDANFTGANLDGAEMANANLTGTLLERQ